MKTLGAALVAVLGLALLPLPVAAISDPPGVLSAGQRLTAESSRAALVNGEFSLTVNSDSMILTQTVILDGPDGRFPFSHDSWFRDDESGKHHANHDRSTLTMRTNGNLVLADSHGAVLWSSHTRGTGTRNRLVLGPRGNLTVRTAAGRVVWTSGSGPTYLPAGRALGSGQRLIDAWDSHMTGYRRHTLTMQADGNLVRRCGKHVLWQSHTHSPGSHLLLRTDGGLVIVSRSDRVVWSAHSGRHRPYAYFDMRDMSVKEATTDRPLWQAKYPFYPC